MYIKKYIHITRRILQTIDTINIIFLIYYLYQQYFQIRILGVFHFSLPGTWVSSQIDKLLFKKNSFYCFCYQNYVLIKYILQCINFQVPMYPICVFIARLPGTQVSHPGTRQSSSVSLFDTWVPLTPRSLQDPGVSCVFF